MSLFKKPKPLTPPVAETVVQDTPAPIPERSTVETEALAEEQRNRRSRTGRASTMLTGGSGVDSSAVTSASRFLGAVART